MTEALDPVIRLVVEVRAVEIPRMFSDGGIGDRTWAQEAVVVPDGAVAGVDFDAMVERVLSRGLAMAKASRP